jgi:hypothetical protein
MGYVPRSHSNELRRIRETVSYLSNNDNASDTDRETQVDNIKSLDHTILILRNIIKHSPSDQKSELDGPILLKCEWANGAIRHYLLDVSIPNCREYGGWFLSGEYGVEFLNEHIKVYVLKTNDRVLSVHRVIDGEVEKPFASFLVNVNGEIDICLHENHDEENHDANELSLDIKRNNTEILDVLQSSHYINSTNIKIKFTSESQDPILQYQIWDTIMKSWNVLNSLYASVRDIVGKKEEKVIANEVAMIEHLKYEAKIEFYGNNSKDVSSIDEEGNLTEIDMKYNVPQRIGSKSLQNLEIVWDTKVENGDFTSIIQFILRQENLTFLSINFENNVDWKNSEGYIKERMVLTLQKTKIQMLNFFQRKNKLIEWWERDDEGVLVFYSQKYFPFD